jgi:hypothetical protein
LAPSKSATKRYQLAYFMVGVVALVVGALTAGADLSVGSFEGMWFELAILAMLAAFVVEPRFTGGTTAVANSLVIMFLYVAVDPGRLRAWWTALFAVATLSLVANVAAQWLPDGSRISARRALVGFARITGGWRATVLPALALALATYNTPFGPEWGLGAAAAVYALFLATVKPHELLRSLFVASADEDRGLRAVGLFPPNEIVVAEAQRGSLAQGSGLRLRTASGEAHAVVIQPTWADDVQCWRAVAPDLHRALSGLPAEDQLRALEITIEESAAGFQDARREITENGADCVGVLTEGSQIRSARIELASGVRASVGDVVWTLKPEGRTYWQVTDVELRRATWAGDTRRALIADAAQVGRWDRETLAFTVDTTSPEPSGLIFRGGQPHPVAEVARPNTHVVGHLVGSAFPVVVHLAPLSRQHAAILGTTGTGKTHLAFALAAALAEAGTRVICVDQTGQYGTRFPDAPVLRGLKDAQQFLTGADQIAVLTPHAQNPIEVINTLARGLLEEFRDQGPLEPAAMARCVVMLDEAHNFVPEAFVIDDWGLKAKAQNTSMVLMESRKFGLGFVLISQRTAMVTKSALSQCNSIFAFQAVDQTGLDYLEGLCGRTHATALPTLPHRTAVVMGQALASNAPVIARVDEASVAVP